MSLLLLLLLVCGHAYLRPAPLHQRSAASAWYRSRVLHASDGGGKEDGNDKPKPANPQGKSTMFERSLNDFIGKRYGAGEAFYGRRQSDLSEEEFQETKAQTEKPLFDEDAPLRGNAILVVGGLESIGQWVAYDLAEKGFAVRVASGSRKDAIEVFGLPGKNVDMLELRAEMPEEALFKAIEGVQAVVLCGNFLQSSRGGEEDGLQRALLRVMDKARAGGGTRAVAKLEVKKLVCVSRLVPWAEASKKAFSFDRLLDLFGANTAVDDPRFVAQHAAMEEGVRSSGLEYVVVRAPPVVDESREGASEDLLLLQSEEGGETPLASLSRRIAAVAGDAGGLSIGFLDLAECVVQSLIQDVAAATFTVCSDPRAAFLSSADDDTPLAQSNAMEAIYGPPPPKRRRGQDRLPRGSYYSILEMADMDMRASYLLRPAESYRRQLEEDEQVEGYWLSRLEVLAKDLR